MSFSFSLPSSLSSLTAILDLARKIEAHKDTVLAVEEGFTTLMAAVATGSWVAELDAVVGLVQAARPLIAEFEPIVKAKLSANPPAVESLDHSKPAPGEVSVAEKAGTTA